MHRLPTSIRALLFGGPARQVRLLLVLSAALIGLFLLLEFVVSLASTGPQDILAVTPSEETTLRVPNGVDLLEFLILAVSLVLALAILLASVGWPIGRASFRPSWSLALGVLTSVALAAAGAYLAFSGILGEPIAYDVHEVKLTSLRSRGLALIAALFLSVTVAGLINWRLLVASIVVWVIAAGAFGLLETEPVDGLLLFPRTARIPVSANFAAAVESHQGVGDAPSAQTVDAAPSDSPADSPQLLVTEVKTTQLLPADSASRFHVSGAVHTRYLRTTTGDVYNNGAWSQLDPVHVVLGKGASAVETLAPLVEELRTTQPEVASILPHYSTVAPIFVHTDQIEMTPGEGRDAFVAGVLPISKNLQGIDTPSTYYPFSETLTVDSSVSSYSWEATVQEFALHAKIKADPAAAAAYLQLPDELPQRVHELAKEVGDTESPYLKALLIQVYLQDEYAFSVAATEAEVQPPDDQDPIDWFIFDYGTGGSAEFSSAFVVLARAAGIPARVVAGWILEEREGIDSTLEGKPHQWAEIALQGLGWVTVDPTPRVDFNHGLHAASEALSCCSSPQVREAAEPLADDPGNPALLLQLFDAIEDARTSPTSIAAYNAATSALITLAFDELIEALLEHEDPLMRTAAAYGLGVLRDPEAVAPLVQALAMDEDPQVRAAAADALGVVGKGKAEEELLLALAADLDVGVRVAAAQALGVLSTHWAAGRMLPSLRSDPSFRVRAEVALALGEIKNSVALRPLLDTRSDDESAVARAAAAEALDRWNCASLVLVLESTSTTIERVAAAELLGERKCSSAIPALSMALSDPSAEVREAALNALLRQGATVTRLENGGALSKLGDVSTLAGGLTASQAPMAAHVPVFEVTGAAQTSYLRTTVGDVYELGGWRQLDPVTVTYASHTSLPSRLQAEYQSPSGAFSSLPSQRRGSAELFGIHKAPADRASNRIRITPAQETGALVFGTMPTSLDLQLADQNGVFFPFSATFFSAAAVSGFSWTSVISYFSPEQYTTAAVVADPTYVQLPSGLPARIGRLAGDITRPYDSPYAKAKALERYLKTQYTYAFADMANTGPPHGQDPVDWFLFDSREGTCGQFSSAFVLLARSVGIPARVVSGWAISPTADKQTVYRDQAHQWAEVALEGIGWVRFEPTASGGAPSRAMDGEPMEGSGDASESEADGQEGGQGDGRGVMGSGSHGSGEGRGGLLSLEGLQMLTSAPPEEREKVFIGLEERGAEVTRLENGGALVKPANDFPLSLYGGLTTRQAPQPVSIPVFEARGAAQTGYLRIAAGDVYSNGVWRQLDPVSIPYAAGVQITDSLREHLRDPNGAFSDLDPQRRSSPELFGLPRASLSSASDRIQIRPAGQSEILPYGVLPTSRDMEWAEVDGEFSPFSATFYSESSLPSFSWTSNILHFSPEQYTRAAVVADPTYTQLPPDLPARIQQLAEDITRPFFSPYAKAKALERYLSTQIPYAFADSMSSSPPLEQDPVDWFLFDSRQGTCGQFSSAFAVMARSIGIPARVVSGWIIAQTADRQIVYTDQAHQWAEIALEGVGWVRFEPTAPGGPPSRVREQGTGTLLPSVLETETTITRSPSEIRRQTPFVVEGTVRTTIGHNVGGMAVELYINETKEHGGTKIGTTTSRFGRFSIEAELPADFELGPFQLLARAVGNERFIESWSDPDIKVFSGSGIELTGPAEAVLDAETVFTGKLTEDNGQAAAGRELAVTFDGITAPSVVTDQAGHFTFSHSFSQLGTHWVEVMVQGEEFLLDNTARLDFQVVLPTEIALRTPASVEVGEQFLLLGELRGVNGSLLGEKSVLVQVGDNAQQSHRTSAEGRFTHTDTLSSAGEFTVRVSFPGDGPELASEETVPIEALYSVLLVLDGPPIVRDGEEFQLTGILRRIIDDRPVPDAEIQVTGGEPLSLVTNAEGMFTWNVQAAFDENTAHDPHESVQGIEVVLEGTDQLASTSATLDVTVGLPRIVVESVGDVARGSEAILRGAVLVGTYPVPSAELTAGPNVAMRTNGVGTFTHPYPIAEDEPLGSQTLVIAAPALEANVTAPLVVKSEVNLIVTPEGSVRPGRMALLRAVLLDDTGAAIPSATLRSSQGVQAVTDAFGVAFLELTVPEPESLPGSRVEFTYAGDSLRTPLTVPYYWEAVITPAGFNWMLWVGMPVLLVLAATGAYADRRYKLRPLLLKRWKAAPTPPAPEAPDMADRVDDVEEPAAPTPQPVVLQLEFQKAATDLADVWAPDEKVVVIVGVTDEDGRAIAGAVVDVSVADDAPTEVAVGDDGTYTFSWSGGELGEHTVVVEFAGDGDYLPSSASRNLRIVDFREEIVRLYNAFLEWARSRAAGVTEQATPREVEALLVSQGLPISQKALDELISRFEEADYSEHRIARRHYEAMYRAWSTVVGA